MWRVCVWPGQAQDGAVARSRLDSRAQSGQHNKPHSPRSDHSPGRWLQQRCLYRGKCPREAGGRSRPPAGRRLFVGGDVIIITSANEIDHIHGAGNTNGRDKGLPGLAPADHNVRVPSQFLSLTFLGAKPSAVVDLTRWCCHVPPLLTNGPPRRRRRRTLYTQRYQPLFTDNRAYGRGSRCECSLLRTTTRYGKKPFGRA